MSRHVIREDDEFKVVVGWDPPLQTFYAQVHDLKKPEDERIILWEEIRRGKDVKEVVSGWVELSEDTAYALLNDKIQNA